ncbi:hypothetical protein DM860_011336 [Cuscuta australis]|uniref:Uncharacterized protein n=1 Tax=Cuscuta australis TaxID=267555 RepID=A0A328DSN7_9ASTE|nr:hypothetical protein DM860_011336 [Cuscuta australis]
MEGDYDSIASSVSSSSSYRSGDDRTLENKQDVLVRKHDLKQVEMDVPAGNHILVKPRFWKTGTGKCRIQRTNSKQKSNMSNKKGKPPESS